jgi:hypothetical protein
MRNRIEDLGRILEMLNQLLDHSLFTEEKMRPKDFPEWFERQDKEKQEHILRRFSYGLEEIQISLGEILEVARGEDFLNEEKGEV